MATKIFVALIDEAQEYQRLQAAEARSAADRAGIPIEVAFAENNAVLQIQQLFERIHRSEDERPAIIVVQTTAGEGLQRVARNAVSSGIGWLALNRRVPYIEELRHSRPDLPVAMVTPDQIEVGRIQGRQVRSLAPQGGLVLYIQGPPDASSAQDRLEGARGVLGDTVSWKVLAAEWTEDSARRAVNSWLRLKTSQHQRPAVIVAQNDAMAMGARRAVAALQPDWANVPVIGVDALPEVGQRLVSTRQLAASVVLPPTAGIAIEMAARWLRHGTLPPHEVVVPPASHPLESAIRPPALPGTTFERFAS